MKKHRLTQNEIDRIVSVFRNKTPEEDFSVAVSYDEVKEKGYSLSAGQYFDVKINYVDITEEEFNSRIAELTESLENSFSEGRTLEERILSKTKSLTFNNLE